MTLGIHCELLGLRGAAERGARGRYLRSKSTIGDRTDSFSARSCSCSSASCGDPRRVYAQRIAAFARVDSLVGRCTGRERLVGRKSDALDAMRTDAFDEIAWLLGFGALA
jgi:hypothetical protein